MSEREVEHFALSACESASVSANTFVMCAFFFFLCVCGWVRECAGCVVLI